METTTARAHAETLQVMSRIYPHWAEAVSAGADALTRLVQVEADLSEALESARGAWEDEEAMRKALSEARAETQRYREAIEWALGERDEFPAEEPPPLAGKYRQRYYWRTELRRRAALTGAAPEGTAR